MNEGAFTGERLFTLPFNAPSGPIGHKTFPTYRYRLRRAEACRGHTHRSSAYSVTLVAVPAGDNTPPTRLPPRHTDGRDHRSPLQKTRGSGGKRIRGVRRTVEKRGGKEDRPPSRLARELPFPPRSRCLQVSGGLSNVGRDPRLGWRHLRAPRARHQSKIPMSVLSNITPVTPMRASNRFSIGLASVAPHAHRQTSEERINSIDPDAAQRRCAICVRTGLSGIANDRD